MVGPRPAAGALSQQRARFVAAPALSNRAWELSTTHCCAAFTEILGVSRPGTLAGYSAAFKIPGTLNYGLGVVRSWNRDLAELESALPRIANIPTLLLWGSKDTAVSPDSAERLRQEFRDCRVEIFDGVGHLPYEEVPETIQLIRDCDFCPEIFRRLAEPHRARTVFLTTHAAA